ncbi:Uncharacterised protein [Vibrio cholerae]|nr:Uncharacterised protein [Vibrio cholerae]CSI69689.1 Uncharacterised protein [Vibrio cholerae]
MKDFKSTTPRLTAKFAFTFCRWALLALNLSMLISPATSKALSADKSGSTSAGAFVAGADDEDAAASLAGAGCDS